MFVGENHGLLEFASSPPLGGGFDATSGRPSRTLIHNLPCRTPHRLFIHKIFSGPLGLHLLVWSEVARFPPFQPMRALALPWSGGLQPCVWSATHEPSLRAGSLDLVWAWYRSFNWLAWATIHHFNEAGKTKVELGADPTKLFRFKKSYNNNCHRDILF